MKGFKAFNKDLTCRGFQYEIGQTYEMEEEPKLCNRGFHFCKTIAECYNYYSMSENTRICEVEALGEIDSEEESDKLCTNKIKILKEITTEWEKKGNTKSSNTGYCNTGDWNTGDRNTGDWNTGSSNTGSMNTGYWNTGYWNTGDWNTGNWNTGVFCTEKNPTIKLFDKESNWTMQDWLNSNARYILSRCPVNTTKFVSKDEMSEEEKQEHSEYRTIGGYLKTITVSKADKQAWWNNLKKEERQEVLNLPNFDKDIFFKCTGIEVE